MPVPPRYRDWRQETALYNSRSPYHRQFDFIVDQLKETFCQLARDAHPRITHKDKDSTPEERLASRQAHSQAVKDAEAKFRLWYAPLRTATMNERGWTSLFRPHSGRDKREEAVAELDGWLDHVERNPERYSSPKSLVRIPHAERARPSTHGHSLCFSLP